MYKDNTWTSLAPITHKRVQIMSIARHNEERREFGLFTVMNGFLKWTENSQNDLRQRKSFLRLFC